MSARLIGLAVLFGLAVSAAPPLTTIQDVLYKADGSTFTGYLLVDWKSFDAPDTSDIAQHSLTVPIVNGVLRVQLVPTPSGVTYHVRYVSDGRVQFTETWSVPESATALRVRNVRVVTSSDSGTPAPETQIQESDVIGLVSDLTIRPVKGAGFAPSRAAVIDETGSIGAALGTLSDCVRVDGTSGPCGTGPVFVDGETPIGPVDGFNDAFTLADTPDPSSSLALYRNGLLQKEGTDFTLSDNVITFVTASIPQTGDVLLTSYRLPGEGGLRAPSRAMRLAPLAISPLAASVADNPVLSRGTPQVLCAGMGSRTGAVSPATLATCAIPPGVLKPGDRVEIRFDYSHEGTATPYAFEVRWGGETVILRDVPAKERTVSGRASAGIHREGAQLSGESWGRSLGFAATAAGSDASAVAGVRVEFLGRVAKAGTDTVTLRNYTVALYRALE